MKLNPFTKIENEWKKLSIQFSQRTNYHRLVQIDKISLIISILQRQNSFLLFQSWDYVFCVVGARTLYKAIAIFKKSLNPKLYCIFINISMSLGAVSGIVLLNLVSGNNNNDNNNSQQQRSQWNIYSNFWLVLIKMQIHFNNNSCVLCFMLFFFVMVLTFFFGFKFDFSGTKVRLCLCLYFLLSELRLAPVYIFFISFNFIITTIFLLCFLGVFLVC